MTELLDPEEGGTVILQNIGNFTPNTTVSHPERLDTSNLKFMTVYLALLNILIETVLLEF